jgi:hypothetical protein
VGSPYTKRTLVGIPRAIIQISQLTHTHAYPSWHQSARADSSKSNKQSLQIQLHSDIRITTIGQRPSTRLGLFPTTLGISRNAHHRRPHLSVITISSPSESSWRAFGTANHRLRPSGTVYHEEVAKAPVQLAPSHHSNPSPPTRLTLTTYISNRTIRLDPRAEGGSQSPSSSSARLGVTG